MDCYKHPVSHLREAFQSSLLKESSFLIFLHCNVYEVGPHRSVGDSGSVHMVEVASNSNEVTERNIARDHIHSFVKVHSYIRAQFLQRVLLQRVL